MTPPNEEEWRIQRIVRDAVREEMREFAERIGGDDMGRLRRVIDFAGVQMDAASKRSDEGRKTVFTLLGGLVVAIAGYLAAMLKGHQ